MLLSRPLFKVKAKTPCTYCSVTMQNRDHMGIMGFQGKKTGRRGLGNGQKKSQTGKTAGEKIKNNFFSNQLPGFKITKNLDASEKQYFFRCNLGCKIIT